MRGYTVFSMSPCLVQIWRHLWTSLTLGFCTWTAKRCLRALSEASFFSWWVEIGGGSVTVPPAVSCPPPSCENMFRVKPKKHGSLRFYSFIPEIIQEFDPKSQNLKNSQGHFVKKACWTSSSSTNAPSKCTSFRQAGPAPWTSFVAWTEKSNIKWQRSDSDIM